MNKDKRFEILAEIDGYETCVKCGEKMELFPRRCESCRYLNEPIPNYDSHDALQNIIKGLKGLTLKKFILELYKLSTECGSSHEEGNWFTVEVAAMFQANTDKIQEAIIRAVGRWEDE